MIRNPILQRAHKAGWYMPWIPPEDLWTPAYETAQEEGWDEWVESELDLEALSHGYMYDQSYDVDGKPCYWIDGQWQMHGGVIVPLEEEHEAVGYCGRGDHFCRYAEAFLRFTKVPLTGQPYRFLDWHRKLCSTLFGWVKRPTPDRQSRYRRFQEAIIEVAKKNGKALADSTPIPTPDGWRRHGDLRVGDRLFDKYGDVCEVAAVHPKCEIDYEVLFSNGEMIRCNGQHEWVVYGMGSFDRRTTDEIRQLGCDHFHLDNHVDLPQVRFISITPIDPVRGNCITVSSKDGTYLCGRKMIPTHNSDLLSVMACYGIMADFTPKSYCYGAACDRGQARIIFNEASSYARSSPMVGNELMVIDSRARILHHNSASFFEVLSSESHRNDGIDANYVFFDELHRQPNRKLYSVLKRAGQARPQPLRVVITTYGPSNTDGSIWAEVHNGAKAQLDGKRNSWRTLVWIASAEPIPVILTAPAKRGDTRLEVFRLQQPMYAQSLEFDLSAVNEDDSSRVTVKMTSPSQRFQRYIEVEPIEYDIPALSEATANEKWADDHGIARANPSVGIVFDYQRLRDEVEAAKSPEAEAETKQLNFNICSGGGRKFISGAAWLACSKLQLQPKMLRGRFAYGGLDLSFGNDLCAFTLAFPKWDHDTKFEFVSKPRVDVAVWCWVPEDTLDARQEQEEFPYRHWAKQPYFFENKGCVRIVQGSVIDFAQVAADIIEICGLCQMRAIGYDPNMAAFCIPTLESAGLPCVAHRQGGVSMAPPTKAFSNLVYRTLLCHGDNPLLTRAVENAVLHTPDRAGNTYPSKQKSHARIDALVSTIMAVGFSVSPPVPYDGAYSGEVGAGMWG